MVNVATNCVRDFLWNVVTPLVKLDQRNLLAEARLNSVETCRPQ